MWYHIQWPRLWPAWFYLCPVDLPLGFPESYNVEHKSVEYFVIYTFQGLRMPLKNSGIMIGSTTASCKMALASLRPATSHHCMPGSRCKMSFSKLSTRCASYPDGLNIFFLVANGELYFGELCDVEFSSIDVASWSSSPSSDEDFFGFSFNFNWRKMYKWCTGCFA